MVRTSALIALIVICILPHSSFGQSYFFSGIPDVTNFKNTAVYKRQGGFSQYIEYDSVTVRKHSLLLFNSAGAPVVRKTFSSNEQIDPASFYFLRNGNYIVCGDEVLSDTTRNAFICYLDSNNNQLWGKKINSPRPLNFAGPVIEDSSRVFAAFSMKRGFGSIDFEDFVVSVFNTTGNLLYTRGLISSAFASEMKLTHAIIARNGDYIGLASYSVNDGFPGKGLIFFRMSNTGVVKYNRYINFSDTLQFLNTRGIAETENGNLFIAAQVDSIGLGISHQPAFVAVFTENGQLLDQKLIGYQADTGFEPFQLGVSSNDQPFLFGKIIDGENTSWGMVAFNAMDGDVTFTRSLPLNPDIKALDSDASQGPFLSADLSGGFFAAGGLFCTSESKSFPVLLHWSNQATLECPTFTTPDYFADSAVNYQVSVYDFSALNTLTVQNFTIETDEEIKPFIQNLCGGCQNLTATEDVTDQMNLYPIAQISENRMRINNSTMFQTSFTVFSVDGRLLRSGNLAPYSYFDIQLDAGLHLVQIGDYTQKMMMIK
jgi:hypothetical protein